MASAIEFQYNLDQRVLWTISQSSMVSLDVPTKNESLVTCDCPNCCGSKENRKKTTNCDILPGIQIFQDNALLQFNSNQKLYYIMTIRQYKPSIKLVSTSHHLF